jgi:hypothetical protein
MNPIKTFLKYFIAAAIIYIICIIVTKSTLSNHNIITISIASAAAFAILDRFAPSYIIKDKYFTKME